MTNPTTPFSWQMPTSTDLVTDLPADFEVFGQAVATSMADLLGGTTGQILAKASNTNMDFTWVTTDDANAIQNAIVDAKGDLIAASAADTPARLAVGNNGETLVADSSTATGLSYQANWAAGKNKIINGDFGIWQRGTSFTTYNAYWADRWTCSGDRTSPSFSRQTFTAGTAPVTGYEGEYYARWVPGSGGTYSGVQQRIENVRTFANQSVTLSYWARISTGTATNSPYIIQNFGSGGSGEVSTALSTSTITTTWTRFTHSFTVPSVSGKTIGASSYLAILPMRFETASTANVDFWGVQIEASSVATAFQTSTGSIQGETSACQRYYFRTSGTDAYKPLSPISFTTSATTIFTALPMPVEMRTSPTSVEYGGAIQWLQSGGGAVSPSTFTITTSSKTMVGFNGNSTGLTTSQFGSYRANNDAAAYFGFSAEL